MADPLAATARLMILRELAEQTDGRSNDIMLDHVLSTFGVRRSRDWLRTQLRALVELDAIRVEAAGDVMVASLRQTGRDHVERRAVLEGVARPADDR